MGGLEETERAESETLVKLVTEAIKGHTMCKFCKGRNQAMGWSNVHLSMANMADIQAQHGGYTGTGTATSFIALRNFCSR